MKIKYLLLSLLIPFIGRGQQWIDTTHTIQTSFDIQYGTATDFAGNSINLEMDISYPTNDTIPPCGRPLILLIHGGAWLVGSKEDVAIVRMREDFAKRGYTSASVNYRLGQYNTDAYVNCNASSLFNVNWNCLNMTDEGEWYRAKHRAVQDVNGAIRFLVNNAATYDIDPSNIFIAGESAGGFIALSAGFIDDNSEVLDSLTGLNPDAPAPNTLYESSCIQANGFAVDIDSMDLRRPDLGSYEGALNYPANAAYSIKGVGSFFGGVFTNIFHSNSSNIPGLYLYHQPCDLIVPYNYSRVFTDYQNCLMGFPTYCGYIVNKPYVYGSYGIKLLLDTMDINGIPTPDYLLDNTTNTWNCIEQANPSQVGHAIDNYWLRTSNMAVFFAAKIESCSTSTTEGISKPLHDIVIFPNPSSSDITIDLNENYNQVEITFVTLLGQFIKVYNFHNLNLIKLNLNELDNGAYLMNINLNNEITLQKKIIKAID